MEEKKVELSENDTNEIISEDSSDQHSTNQLEKTLAELSEQKDKFLRLSAEFDNYKRRNAKERIELMQTAGRDIIVSLLDVLDDSERAEKQLKLSGEQNENNAGTLLVFNKLRNILQQKGLTAMESINTEFDVEKHEAISEIEVPEDKKGKVIDELMKGYYLNEKIIRFAKVVVGK